MPFSFPSVGFKQILTVYTFSLLALCSPSSSEAVILLRDSFDYPADSNLRDQVNPSGQTWAFVGSSSAIAVAPAIGAGNLT